MTRILNQSSLYTLGRRIERLFLAGVLLIVLCCVEIYFVTADRLLNEDQSAGAIGALLDRVQLEESSLDSLFQMKPELPANASNETQTRVALTRQKLGLPPPNASAEGHEKKKNYAQTLRAIIEKIAAEHRANRSELSIYSDPLRPPKELIKELRQKMKSLDDRPAVVFGIQTPHLLQLQYAGVEYKFPFGFLASAFEVALGLLIVGWLGAVYMTRQRELLLIANADDFKTIFPHFLNFLPIQYSRAVTYQRFGRKTKRRDIERAFNMITQAFSRSLVILVFAVPLVCVFVYSLARLWEASAAALWPLFSLGAFMGCVMAVQTLLLVFQESYILFGKVFYE